MKCSIFIFENKNPSRISNERDFSFLEKQQKFFSKKSEMGAVSTVYHKEKIEGKGGKNNGDLECMWHTDKRKHDSSLL